MHTDDIPKHIVSCCQFEWFLIKNIHAYNSYPYASDSNLVDILRLDRPIQFVEDSAVRGRDIFPQPRYNYYEYVYRKVVLHCIYWDLVTSRLICSQRVKNLSATCLVLVIYIDAETYIGDMSFNITTLRMSFSHQLQGVYFVCRCRDMILSPDACHYAYTREKDIPVD